METEVIIIYSFKQMEDQEKVMLQMQNCKLFLSAFSEIEGEDGRNVLRIKKEYQGLACKLKKLL